MLAGWVTDDEAAVGPLGLGRGRGAANFNGTDDVATVADIWFERFRKFQYFRVAEIYKYNKLRIRGFQRKL